MSIRRTLPMRKPAGFTPAVQRWSAHFPSHTTHVKVGYYGVQGVDDDAIARSPFPRWVTDALADGGAPAAFDRVRFIDGAGQVNQVLIGYWTELKQFQAWRAQPWNVDWWQDPARLTDAVGCWREELQVSLDRQETIYFPDFKGGIARCPDARLEKTFESGYWGAMRDRIPAAATDPLSSPLAGLTHHPTHGEPRSSRGARWLVTPPEQLAVIRSGQYWERCGEQQRGEYLNRLRPRLEEGLNFLATHPEESGCCSLRYLQHLNEAGAAQEESSVHGLFLSLADLERWAESHVTHKAIYAEAFRQLRQYQERREFRTWHEVFVLEGSEQHFEYVNCHPQTGLLPYFDASPMA